AELVGSAVGGVRQDAVPGHAVGVVATGGEVVDRRRGQTRDLARGEDEVRVGGAADVVEDEPVRAPFTRVDGQDAVDIVEAAGPGGHAHGSVGGRDDGVVAGAGPDAGEAVGARCLQVDRVAARAGVDQQVAVVPRGEDVDGVGGGVPVDRGV